MRRKILTSSVVTLTKEAAKKILGASTAIRTKLDISAPQKGEGYCTKKGVIIKVSKNQLSTYFRPI